MARFGGSAVPGVRTRVAATESPEVRQRAAAFLKRFDPAVPLAARVREGRAVELLEAVDSPGGEGVTRRPRERRTGVPLTVDAGAALSSGSDAGERSPGQSGSGEHRNRARQTCRGPSTTPAAGAVAADDYPPFLTVSTLIFRFSSLPSGRSGP